MKLIKHIALIGFLLVNLPSAAQVDANYFLQKGWQAYQQKDYNTAIEELQRVLGLDSASRNAYHLLAASYLASQKANNALIIARKGLERYPQDLNLRWLKAEASLQLLDYKEALSDYKVIARQKNNENQLPSQINPETLYQRMGQVCLQLGQQSVEQEDFAVAIRYFKNVKLYLPEQEIGYVNLAIAYTKTGQWKNALQVVEEAMDRFPEQENLLKIKTMALYHLKDFESLTAVYEQLHGKNPENVEIAVAYAELLMGNQQTGTASEIYNQLLQKYPRNKEIYESLLRIYESKFNYQGKLQVLHQMLPYFDKAEIYKQIAQTLEGMNRWVEARKYYDTLLLFSEADLPIRKKIGQTYLAQDCLVEAQNYFAELNKDYPKNADVLKTLAGIQLKTKHWQAALASYEKLLSLEPTAETSTYLGYVHQQVDHPNQALNYYLQAREKADEPVAYWGAATILQPVYPDSAFQLAEKALAIALAQLQKQEKQLKNQLTGQNKVTRFNQNKNLLQEIKLADSITTLVFNHLATYEYTRARQSILNLTQDFNQSAKLHFLMGKFYHQHQQWGLALKQLQLATQLNPNLWENQSLMGDIHQLMGENTPAMLAYERVLTLQKSNIKAHQALVKLYQQENQLDMLCDKWLARYQADQENEILREYLIAALHKNGRTAVAKKIIKEAKESKDKSL
jgi:tetratricopeptide (TPR) repeat protein